MATLLELAKDRFSDLTDAERALVVQVSRGDPPSLPAGPDNAKPVVRPRLLVWLLTDSSAADAITGNTVVLNGARVAETLDLDACTILHRFVALNCRFDNGISLRSTVSRSLTFRGCSIAKGALHSAIMADDLHCTGDLSLRGGFEADGGVRLIAARVTGDLECTGGRFINPGGIALCAGGLSCGGGVYLRARFHAEGEVNLLSARVVGDLDCTDGSFLNPGGSAISADGMSCKGGVYLREKFRAEGRVGFIGARLSGTLSCTGGSISNPGGSALLADNLACDGGVYIRDGFRAKGRVSLHSANVLGPVLIYSCTIEVPGGTALLAWNLVAKAGVRFRPNDQPTIIRGGIDLREVRIQGTLALDGLTQSASPGADPSGFRVGINLRRARIEGPLIADTCTHSKHDESVWTLLSFDGAIDLRSAEASEFVHDKELWRGGGERSEWARLLLQGFRYRTLTCNHKSVTPSIRDYLVGMSIPERGRERSFSLDPHRQIAKTLRAEGRDHEADILMWLAWRQKSRHERPTEIDMGRSIPKLLRYVLRFFGDAFLGHGYLRHRPVGALLIVWVIGWAIFFVAHDRHGEMGYAQALAMKSAGEDANPEEETEKWLGEEYPEFRAWIYSIDVLVPLINLRQEDYWKPKGDLLAGYNTLHTGMGWLLSSLAVVGFTGLVRDDKPD